LLRLLSIEVEEGRVPAQHHVKHISTGIWVTSIYVANSCTTGTTGTACTTAVRGLFATPPACPPSVPPAPQSVTSPIRSIPHLPPINTSNMKTVANSCRTNFCCLGPQGRIAR
jgi:hypothetical protein